MYDNYEMYETDLYSKFFLTLNAVSDTTSKNNKFIVLDSNEHDVLLFNAYILEDSNHDDEYRRWNMTEPFPDWNSCYLKTYLNTDYYNTLNKDFRENLVDYGYGKVFCLSKKDLENLSYFKYKHFRFINSGNYWLQDKYSDYNAYYIDFYGNIEISNDYDSTCGVRPAYWVKKSYLLNSYFTPLYNQVVEMDTNYQLCVREQLNAHNKSMFIYTDPSFISVKKDISLFEISTENNTSIYNYNFLFRHQTYKEYKIQNGVYFNANLIFKVDGDLLTATYINIKDSQDILFNSSPKTFDISSSLPDFVTSGFYFYLDCCEDINPILWKYLPIFHFYEDQPSGHDEDPNWKGFIYWLGNKYTLDSFIYEDLLKRCVYESQYI